MPIFPAAYVNQSQIKAAVERAVQAVAPDVVRIRYSLDDDWTGEPSIFFRVIVSDSAIRGTRLHEIAERISRTIRNEVKPDELGLHSYFNYRSFSEQVELQEAAWT